jgi:hypothetical protein
MKPLRPATPEEIEKIAATSDIDPTCMVVALDTQLGPILYVVRKAVEVDPVYMPEGFSPKHFSMAIRDIGNFLLGHGVTHYYFNLHADDSSKEYRDAIEKWGATAVSTAPDIRYRKQLI